MARRFGIPELTTAIVLIAVFAMAVRVPTSPDMWWHLRCGEIQWRTGSVIREDIFSHTARGTPWVDQSWLPQLAMYGLYVLGGFSALAVVVALLVASTFALVLLCMPAEPKYAYFGRALVVLWAAISTGRVWVTRPHITTFVLTAAWVYLLDRHRRRTPHSVGVLWWLPPLTVLWANCHGGYIIGFVLLSIQVGGIVGTALYRRQFAGLWREVRPLLITAALCVPAVLINPQGIRLALFPFQALGSSAQQNLISEWSSPDFHAIDMLPFLGLLIAAWSALTYTGRRVTGIDWLRLTFFTALSLRSGRYIGLTAVVISPLLFKHGASVWASLSANWGWRPSARPASRGAPLLNWSILLLVLIATGVKSSLAVNPETIARAHRALFPERAVEYMLAHDLPPTLFNDYGWGGYLIWRLHPDVPVFIDGRADPFGDELIRAYQRTVAARREWEDVLDAYDVHTALIGADSSLASAMHRCETWQVLYEDDKAAIFTTD